MAAIYTQNLNLNPMIITADIAATGSAPNATGWKGLQKLTGNLTTAGILLPSTIQNPGPIIAQPGIRVVKMMLVPGDTVTTTAGNVFIQNPDDSSYLYPIMYVATVAAASYAAPLVNENLNPPETLMWKDFIVTGLTATKTALFIWYR